LANPTHFLLAEFAARSSPHALIPAYDEAGNVIETHEQAGEFKECQNFH
jgi:hypothetical protein